MRKKLHKNGATLRNRFSISRRHLAGFLNVSPSLISMYEKGLRDMPDNAHFKLLQLTADQELSRNKAGKSVTTLKQQLNKQLDQASETTLLNAEYYKTKVPVLQGRLKDMQEKQEDDMDWLNLIDHKLASQPSKDDRNWMEIQQEIVTARLCKNHKAIIKLRLQIELTKASATVHRTYHGQLKKKRN